MKAIQVRTTRACIFSLIELDMAEGPALELYLPEAQRQAGK